MKKSLYVFLCSLMGALLFLILHRILVFFYTSALTVDYASTSFALSYMDYVALDLFTLILAVLGGAWYGIWIGLYWYQKIYEEGSHGGFIDHMAIHYWPKGRHNYKLSSKIKAVQKQLENNLWEYEDLAKTAVVQASAAPKPRVARRKPAVKKTSKNNTI